jgi:hypothetical protein
MEIQMVTAQVGESHDIETGSIHPLQGQSVRRHLHHDVRSTSLSHRRE